MQNSDSGDLNIYLPVLCLQLCIACALSEMYDKLLLLQLHKLLTNHGSKGLCPRADAKRLLYDNFSLSKRPTSPSPNTSNPFQARYPPSSTHRHPSNPESQQGIVLWVAQLRVVVLSSLSYPSSSSLLSFSILLKPATRYRRPPRQADLPFGAPS